MRDALNADAVRLVNRARREASTLRHRYVGTEHLLLALTCEDFGFASDLIRRAGITERALRGRITDTLGAPVRQVVTRGEAEALLAIGIDVEQIRRETEDNFGPGALDAPACSERPIVDVPLSARMKRTLKKAARTGSIRRGIGPERVLLAVVSQPDVLATKLLRALGSDPLILAAELNERLRQAS